MPTFSNEEKLDIILIYGECHRNATAAVALYAERYPDRRCPSRRTIGNICKTLTETGSWTPTKRRRTTPATGNGNEIAVLAAVAHNPQVGVRQIARDVGISRSSVCRILHRHRFHPFHISLHQELYGNDFQSRIAFCQFALQQLQGNPVFLSNILFTDEASFTNHGNVNLRNMHYWSVQNPRWIRQVAHQRQWSVNVWCGIIANCIVGPYFYRGTLNGQRYASFLQHTLPLLMEDLGLETRLSMWFQHDGCPAHTAKVARDVLDATFPNRWIGRGGTVRWPARSPDVTPLDFFLWGAVKDRVYQEPPTTVEDMQHRITAACAAISVETLQSVQHSLVKRLQTCIDANGRHFEHMLT